jgi:hypothetical protein
MRELHIHVLAMREGSLQPRIEVRQMRISCRQVQMDAANNASVTNDSRLQTLVSGRSRAHTSTIVGNQREGPAALLTSDS